MLTEKSTMDDATFHARYNIAPNIFKDWMKNRLELSNATILDFGCDSGVMALGIVNHCHPKRVIGTDINKHHKNLFNEVSSRFNIHTLPDNLKFYVTDPDEKLKDFLLIHGESEIDCIFSWSVFEHVSQQILNQMVCELYKTVRIGGYVFIQIAPLYYSAFGSHLETLVPEPWAHLKTQLNIFQHQILNSRKVGPYLNEEDDNFEKIKNSLWSTYSTLNKITADELVNLFLSAGFVLINEFRSVCEFNPGKDLMAIYTHEVLITEQIVALFRKV